ncbi:MAG: hypothetical protein JSV16_09405 [Candidatus Hydrogenedentota bacterium]|nr:MAG: hypothetical protein JSV16_09405 [Candidatus Hydrogenedentota bacterium]
MSESIEKKLVVRVFGLSVLSLNSQTAKREAAPKTEARQPEAITDGKAIRGEEEKRMFVINSMMLRDCFKRLTRTNEEDLIVVTGSCVDHIRSLERIIPVSLSRQSVVGAKADDQSLADGLINLYEFGLRPLAYFHSHPGLGIDATHPSGTDRETQSALEQSGGEIIGGIFSRDRFVRFYANGGEPNVKVVGKRVTEVEKNVYRLEAEEDVRE